jgi:group I intron endonuclease
MSDADVDAIRRSGIYAYIHLETGRAYVGQAFDWHRRSYEHLSRLRNNRHKNPHLQSAFNKYGASAFTFVRVEACEISALTAREKYWMEECAKRVGIFNSCPAGGSPLGVKRSAETRAKISAASKGRLKGRKHTAEELAKMSQWQIGRKRPPFSPQWYAKMRPYWEQMRGKKRVHSQETKEKISATLRKRSRQICLPM